MLDSVDISDALSRATFLTKVTENDQKLVMQVRSDAEYVRQMRGIVDNLKQAQAEDTGMLTLQKQQLAGTGILG